VPSGSARRVAQREAAADMSPIPILLYHSVDVEASPAYRPWCVDPALFADHLDMIGDLGFTCLTLSGLVDGMATGDLPDRPLAITFDDGRADFSEHAVPLLVERGLPATIYLVTGCIGGTSSWLPIEAERDQPMMSWADVDALASVGIESGAHTVTHPQLDLVGTERARREITESRHHLEQRLGAPVRSFAYPHGFHTRQVSELVAEAGFDSACAVRDTWSHVDEDRFGLSRLVVRDSTTTDDLWTRLMSVPDRPARRHAARQVGYRWIRRAGSVLQVSA
jgi:peptidoglycan/xylan/chitin deacetylase (PgdA/CDA1 family)